MVCSVCIDRASSTKKPSTAENEAKRIKILKENLGKYSLTTLTRERIAGYRDKRTRDGMSATSVRIELAILSHLYTTAIREWRLGLIMNPVSLVRKPKPAEGRNRRLTIKEESRLLEACCDMLHVITLPSLVSL